MKKKIFIYCTKLFKALTLHLLHMIYDTHFTSLIDLMFIHFISWLSIAKCTYCTCKKKQTFCMYKIYNGISWKKLMHKVLKEITFLYIKKVTCLDFSEFLSRSQYGGWGCPLDEGICVCIIIIIKLILQYKVWERGISIHSISFNTNPNYLLIFVEQRDLKMKKKHMQQQLKQEDQMLQLSKRWANDILPNWELT